MQVKDIKLDKLYYLLKLRNKLCKENDICSDCPMYGIPCCIDDIRSKEDALAMVAALLAEDERQNCQRRKDTILIPDEMTNVFTFQATYIDKAGYEYTEAQKRVRRRFMEELLRGALPNADDLRCVDFQQFVTKAHEQSEEEREDAEKWHE